MNVERPPGDPNMLEGDIVVTAVARHYALSRIQGEGETHEYLGVATNRGAALEQACAVAGAKHRVFLFPSAGTSEHVPFDCAGREK
jgi:hypothetical protein